MAKIIVKRGMPGDDTHLWNALNYVSDGRALMIGGNGVDYTDPNEAYRQMNAVKEYYGKTKNCSLVHMIMSYPKNVNTAEAACEFTKQIAKSFGEDYQMVFCAHEKDNECSTHHGHMIFSPVNVNNGKMMQTDHESLQPLCQEVSRITGANYQVEFKKNGSK